MEAMVRYQDSETMKQMLERLVRAKSPRVSLRGNVKGKNRLIWSQFKIAYLDGVEQPYASCRYCDCLMKYTGRTGTGGLMRHFCYRQVTKATDLEGDGHKRLAMEQQAEELKHTSDPSSTLDKPSLRSQLEVLIFHNSPRIGFITNCKGKSGVWSQFHIITLDNVPVDFACCAVCRNIVTYQSRTGTGSMTRHKCAINIRRQRLLPNILSKSKKIHNQPSIQMKPNKNLNLRENVWEVETIKAEPEEHLDEEMTWREDGTAFSPNSEGQQKRLVGLTPYGGAPFFTSLSEYLMERGKSASSPPSPALSPKPETEEMTKEMEDVVRGKHLAFLRNSLSLLNISQNESFLQFAQALVDLGARYGKVDVREMFRGHVNFSDLLQD